MLVLSRLPNEGILLKLPTDPNELQKLCGATILVKYVPQCKNQARVRLGFEAPDAIDIIREELNDHDH